MATIRILLDTCAARNFLHQNGTKLDANAIGPRLWKYRISLADPCVAELTRQLVERRLKFSEWSGRIHALDKLLDPRWPFFVGGRDLGAVAGLQTDLTFDPIARQLEIQTLWRWMRDSADEAHYLAGTKYVDASGVAKELKPNPAHISSTLDAERQTWIDYVNEMKQNQKADPAVFSTLAKTKAVIRSGLGAAPTDPPDLADRLDGIVSVQAELIFTSYAHTPGYNPASQKRRGDLFDLALLFALPLPAVIVTADNPFLDRVRRAASPDSKQLISVDDFNQHALNDTLESLIAHHPCVHTQEQRWREAAYFRWLRRGAPMDDDWQDWFASEPLA
jgi:hypothetical protein